MFDILARRWHKMKEGVWEGHKQKHHINILLDKTDLFPPKWFNILWKRLLDLVLFSGINLALICITYVYTVQLFSSVWHKDLISTLRNLSIGKTQIRVSQQYNINTINCLWASVHCHLAWEEQPSPMMQAWLASLVWLVWQGTPTTETTGFPSEGLSYWVWSVTIRTSFFFDGGLRRS